MIADYTAISDCACWIDGKRGITFNASTGLISAIAEQSGNATVITIAGNPLYHESPQGILFPSNINANLPTTNASTYAVIKLPDTFTLDSANSTVFFVISLLNSAGESNGGGLFPLLATSNANGNNLMIGDRGRMMAVNSLDFLTHHGPPDTHAVGQGPIVLAMSFRGGTLKLYCNGVEYDTGVTFGSVGASGSPKFIIGGDGTGFGTHVFTGVVHDVVLYRHNLTLQEIADATEYAAIRWGITTGAPSAIYSLEGDSIPYGNGSQWAPTTLITTGLIPTPHQSWPTQLAMITKRRICNWAYPGTQISSHGTASIQNIAVTNGGSGYGTAPTVSINVGSGVTATATVTNGAVTAITVNNQGNGHYTYVPPVAITGGGSGSGCVAQAVVSSGLVTAINVISGGKDYTSAPTVSVHASAGSGATATATVSGGVVTAITMTANGSSYDVLPDVTFSGGGGSGAAAQAGYWFAAGAANGGTGYATAPTIVATNATGDSGSGFAATVTRNGDGTLSALTITNHGHGYTKPPVLSVQGGGGSGAKFWVTMSTNGGVASNLPNTCPTGVAGIAIGERGTNDMGTSFTGLQTFMAIRNWAWAMKSAGFKYVLHQDIMPRGGASPISAANLSQCNQLLAQYNTAGAPNNDGAIDLVVQVSGHPLLQNTGDVPGTAANLANMFSDGIHPTPIGHPIIGQIWADAIKKFVPLNGGSGGVFSTRRTATQASAAIMGGAQ